jgi:hypothetical protein
MPATTPLGVPYVLPSDAVIDYPTVSQDLAKLVVPSGAFGPLWGNIDNAKPIRTWGGAIYSGQQSATGDAPFQHNLGLSCYLGVSVMQTLTDQYNTGLELYNPAGWDANVFWCRFLAPWAGQQIVCSVILIGQQ